MDLSILSRSIMDDIAAGEEFVTLSQARRDRQLRIDGRDRDLSWCYRATGEGVRGADGTRVILESTTQSGLKVTTPSAITRFVYYQIHGSTKPTASPADSARAHVRAERSLAGAGL